MSKSRVERTVYLKSQEVLIHIVRDATTWTMTGIRVPEPPAGVEEYATVSDLQREVYIPLGIFYYAPYEPGVVDRFMTGTVEGLIGKWRAGKYKDYGKVLWTRTGSVKYREQHD